MHQFIHTLSFLSESDSPQGPAKECDDLCKKSAPIIFGEMVNSCSCSVKIRSSWLYYFDAPYFQYSHSPYLLEASGVWRISRTQMRCELVQRLTIFKADRPMNHELVSSHHCLSCNKFRAQLRAAKRKSQTTIFPSEVFTPSNQLRMWHFPVSANLINLKLPWFFLLLVNCSKCLAIVRPCPH